MNVSVKGVTFDHHPFRSKQKVVHWIGSGDTNTQDHHTTADVFHHTPIGAAISCGQDVYMTVHLRHNLHGHHEWLVQISGW